MDGTAADVVLDVLEARGARYVFGCPGTTEVPLLDAWIDRPAPRFVLASHEAAAVAMADGYARATGEPGVVLVHANVGLGNALVNAYAAREYRVPLLILNGLKPTDLQGRRGFTTGHDTRDLVREYAKWDWVSLRPELIAEDLERALDIAATSPPGVTYLGLYEDFLGAPVARREVTPRPPQVRTAPDGAAVTAALEVLRAARRPVFLYGDDVAREGAFEVGVQLAERAGAPVLVEHRVSLGWHPFPSDHPLYAGPFRPRHPLLDRCDAVLALGTRLFSEFSPPAGPYFPPGTPVVHVHSDPWEFHREYRAPVQILADVRAAAAAILAQWPSEPRAPQIEVPARPSPTTYTEGPLHPEEVVAVLAELTDEQTTIFADGTTSNEALLRYGRFPGPLSYLASSSASGLSWGLGAAIGFKLAASDRSVVAFLGEGVFLFSVQALSTAARLGSPLAVVVINNRGYAAVKAGLVRFGGRAVAKGQYPGTDLGAVDCATLARGLGVRARRVTQRDELRPALREAMACGVPAVIEVMTDPEDLGPLRR